MPAANIIGSERWIGEIEGVFLSIQVRRALGCTARRKRVGTTMIRIASLVNSYGRDREFAHPSDRQVELCGAEGAAGR